MRPSFKRALTVVLLIATALCTPNLTAAQDKTTLNKKVVFPKGRTTAVLKASIKKGTNHHYLLRARAGQTMTVHLAAKQCGFTVYLPNEGAAIEEADGVTDWSGELPESGEYTIEVATDARLTPYTLEVTIR